jgi:hypothetical protein
MEGLGKLKQAFQELFSVLELDFQNTGAKPDSWR